MMHATGKALLKPLALVLILSTQVLPQSAQAVDDPAQLQQQAIQRIDRALEQLRKTGDMQGTLGELQLAVGELSTSFQSLLKAGNTAAASLSALKLGLILRLLDKPDDALTTFGFAYELAVRANHSGHKVRALLGQATTELYRKGKHDLMTVTKKLIEASTLAAIAGDEEGLCDSYHVSAELYLELRDFNAALNSINESFPLATKLKDPIFLFHAYQTRGMIYSDQAGACDYDRQAKLCAQRLDNAKADLQKAQSLAKNLGYAYLVDVIEMALKKVEGGRGLIKSKETSSSIYSSSGIFNPQKVGDVYVNEKFLPPKSSDSKPELLAKKQEFDELIKNASDSARGNFMRGTLKDLLDEPEAALEYYFRAVKLLDADAASLQSDRSLGTFLNDKIEIYYNPMLHLLERKRYAEAFDLLENSRSRAMADLLRSQDVSVQPQDQKLYAEYLTVTAKLSAAQEHVQRKKAGAEKERQDLEAEYQDILKRMNATNSKLLGLIAPQTATLQSLQQSMKQDHYEVLYYLALDTQVILWHISGNETHVVSVLLPRKELINKVDLLRKNLGDYHSKFDEQTANQMFLFLIQPALKWIKTDHLVIIPHEDLNYVPFQAFYDAANKKYVGEMFQLSYAPSASTLTKLKKVRNISGGNLLAVEVSGLEEGKSEVKALGQLFSGRSKIVVDSEPTESDVKNWIGDYDLVHLSVHGKFDNEVPLLSYLELNAGGSDDGKLSTAEMFGLPLTRAQLVVLSACETGQATATRANEVIGMQRALLYAGANNLILSSWQAEPASTELWMTTFYREAQSKSFGEASRVASMTVKSKYSHPHYWSPFLLIGK